MISYNDLKNIAKELETTTGLQPLELYQRFMFERILERISVSKYSENFILKGGLLLSAMFGIENRSTRDIDVSIKGIDISKERMIEILNEILSIKLDDNVKFKIEKVIDIREDDEYGGNEYYITGKLENLKVSLEIDISTGDEITPRQLDYKYVSLFEDKTINIYSYNIETLLAEKIETVLRRTLYNGRMKDFYDIYIFLTEFKDDINISNFKKAFRNTLINRDSLSNLEDYDQIFDAMEQYETLENSWKKYTQNNKYAENIEFHEIIELLRDFLEELDIKNKSEKDF